mmetsp:Transcript_14579/g.29158  ORF Transcript_14579/g.29158 Transcript_14579/m.29158 type:complete len:265 (+) Transcript_14579:122-916(+)|eukprot:CAMPEP_0181323660 /NCGR_PEP_ID=MMETSP1101-20121128/19915_1 /TAXON_ID=46948 /ORGANISM="Rhodomonas abbreviata, Strain Caron Lab Isolate" /LENGTH=264 /DNA_ID=CAMNT_0023431725 /DNA_START=120 /DNA_END=914 /DNA_ORIENTATION=+
MKLAVLDALNGVVVEEKPLLVDPRQTYVVPVMRPTSDVDDDSEEGEDGILCRRRVCRVVQLQLCRKHHAVGKLLEASDVLQILEPLQVEGEDVGGALDADALVSLLERAAVVAVELVVLVQRLDPAEVTEAGGDGGVLFDFERQVQKRLVPTGDGLAVEASRLVRQRALEDVLHPRACLLSLPCHVPRGVVTPPLIHPVYLPVELFANLIKDVVHEFVCILVLEPPERFVVLLQHRDKLLGPVHSKLLFVLADRRERLRHREEH